LKTLEQKKKECARSGIFNPPLRPDQRKFRAILASVIVVLLGGAAVLPLASPGGLLSLQTCAFKGVTGLPCPLCGGSRAVQAVLRGDLARALDLNVAALPAVVGLVAVTMALGCEAIGGHAIIDWNALLPRLRSLLPIFVAALCLYWIVHLVDAIRSVKSELVNLHNPIARAVCQRFSAHKQ
jgi:hypothetical protein